MRHAYVLVVVLLGCGNSPAVTSVVSRPTAIAVARPPAVEAPKLRVVEHVMETIESVYLDPSRIVPRAMLRGALRSLEHDIANIAIDDVEHGVVVHVDDTQHAFELDDVDSLAVVVSRLRAIVGFIQAQPSRTTDTATLEYAAVNGMLSTLDPHSLMLDPKAAREMATQVAGKFGGLGMVIDMRTDKTTGVKAVVVTALIAKDMPAATAGLLVDDRIISIDDQSTAAITIDEALAHLRGAPDTKVKLVIERVGLASPSTYVLTRAVIRVSPVHSRLVGRRTGYIQIDQFGNGVADDVKVALDQLRAQGARGWILDLRHNPGGLLNESTKLVDLFVGAGTIVTTVGRDEQSHVTAHDEPQDEHAPLVVLVDEGTASAAEVVTGALKHLGRAVVLGSPTFGKGSVQKLYDLDDGSKLKLSIAQYMFANDISLQAIGIQPDIELEPVLIPAQQVSARDVLQLAPRHVYNEAELETHLTSSRAIPQAKPIASMRYLGAPGDSAGAPDFALQLAADVVAAAARPDRAALLADAKRRVEAARPREAARIAAAFTKLGIDWKAGPDKRGAELTATCTTDPPDTKLVAGGTVVISCVATNRGAATAYQVHARARSDDDAFDGTDLAFGSIAPGASKPATVRVDVPEDAGARRDVLVWTYGAQSEVAAEAPPLPLAIEAAASTKPVPTIAIDDVAAVTTDDHVNLHGSASGQDVVIRVSNRDAKLDDKKVLFRSKRAGKTAVEFATSVELAPGSNLISIIARGSDSMPTTRRLSVYRTR